MWFVTHNWRVKKIAVIVDYTECFQKNENEVKDMQDIQVLMSTYNGAVYLEDQVESILSQQNVNMQLLVRDDGSKDQTISILKAYQDAGKLTFYQGKNLRSAYSFWDLIEKAKPSHYYAFADQDDVWDNDKLACAISKLSSYTTTPALYFCRKRLVDQNLHPMNAEDEIVNHIGLGTNLLHCHAAGCTMVFNAALMQLLRQYQPEVMSMHDSWILRVASACGIVIYDEVAHMDYRQHANNVVGGNTSRFSVLKKRLGTITKRRKDNERTKMAQQLYDHYATYMKNADEKAMLKHFANIRNSWKARRQLIHSDFLQPHNPKERFFVKLIVLLGWI